MNKQQAGTAEKELMKCSFRNLLLFIELEFQEAGQPEKVDEVFRLLYYTLKGGGTDPLTYTFEDFLNLLCEKPQALGELEMIMLRATATALKEEISNQLKQFNN
jgi:hypothetical protein